MVRSVDRNRSARAQGLGKPIPFPAPVGGLNLRDDITAISPDEATILRNWLPNGSGINPRIGFISQSDAVGSGDVTTVMVYEGAASTVPFASSNGGLFDISASTPSTLVAATTYTNDDWVWENFNGYAFGVNGVDTPWRFDGSATSATGFTGSGLTITDLTTVVVSRNRLWLTEDDSADVWYGAIGGVTGALTKFQLSQIADGGFCQAICSWTRDGGSGPDDFTVFIMSTGQCIVYQGDPAATFSLVGKYRTERPVGRKCWIQVGGDVVLITRAGFVPLSVVASGQKVAVTDIPVWGKIAPGVSEDFASYGANTGWAGLFWNGLVIINIPLGSTDTGKQYVLNTRGRQVWTTFNYPATSFADNSGSLIFGGLNDSTAWAVSGNDDNGANIHLRHRSGYILSPNGLNWKVSALKPYILGDGPVSGFIEVSTDFADGDFVGNERQFVGIASGGTDWGDDWDLDWAGQSSGFGKWYNVGKRGASASLFSEIDTAAANVSWTQTLLMIKPGGPRN